MTYKQNLHTHSCYCDGRDTPEEIIETAIQKGFHSIGFSGHSYMAHSTYASASITLERTELYKVEVQRLKEKYKGQFPIFLGLEVDLHSEVDLEGYDYLIGSFHYFKLGEEYVGFDRSPEECRRIVDTYFGGDGLAFAKEYYRQIVALPEKANFDILGHFDLIAKNIEADRFFDPESPEYLEAAIGAIKALAGKIPYFEVNTGCIARGYRSYPYPSLSLIKELQRYGFKPVITSDCHNREDLDCGFAEAERLLKESGFTAYYILTEDGFRAVEF